MRLRSYHASKSGCWRYGCVVAAVSGLARWRHHVGCVRDQAMFRALHHHTSDVLPELLVTDMALAEWNAARVVYPGIEHRHVRMHGGTCCLLY